MPIFSKRRPGSFTPTSLAERIAARRASTDGLPLLDLTINNPTQVLADYPHAEMQEAFGSIRSFRYHPDPFGLLKAREAVTFYYAERGIAMDTDRIALTASTSEAYSLLFKLLCDAGDEVLVPAPSYPLFEDLAALDSVRTVPYRMLYAGGWFIDFEDLQRALSPRTRAILLVNPSNPAGCYLQEEEANALAELASRQHLSIVSDEVFFDYPIPADRRLPSSFAAREDVLSFALNGLSKLAGMPQVKLGWITINGPLAARNAARDRLELILDTYLSVGTPVQAVAGQLMDIGKSIRQQLHGRVCRHFSEAQEHLHGTSANCLSTEGGWSTVIQLPALMDEERWVVELLEEASVLVQPGYFFDMASEPYIVVSLIAEPEVFGRGMRALGGLVKRIGEDSIQA